MYVRGKEKGAGCSLHMAQTEFGVSTLLSALAEKRDFTMRSAASSRLMAPQTFVFSVKTPLPEAGSFLRPPGLMIVKLRPPGRSCNQHQF